MPSAHHVRKPLPEDPDEAWMTAGAKPLLAELASSLAPVKSMRWVSPLSARADERSSWSALLCPPSIVIYAYGYTFGPGARASTTTDVFNAVGDAHRRAILDVLLTGEKPVGAIVGQVSMPQPHVSRHLRVLSEVGLVRCRAEGRRRLYRLAPGELQPLHDWVAKYERAINDRLDRIEDYLTDLQRQGDDSDT